MKVLFDISKHRALSHVNILFTGVGDVNHGVLGPIFVSDCIMPIPPEVDLIVCLPNERTVDGQRLNMIKNPKEIPLVDIPLNDPAGQKDVPNFAKAVKTVVEAVESGKRVLVHCAAGICRSPAVAIAAHAVWTKGKIQDSLNLLVQTRQIFVDVGYLAMGQCMTGELFDPNGRWVTLEKEDVEVENGQNLS